ncbi:MAG TPA: threonine synthase [Vicinamibacterales bacterium]|nr:threonine synthase [Vicinamibacterales bacterium]
MENSRPARTRSFGEAVLDGLAPGGGLYLPSGFTTVPATEIASWRGFPIAEIAVRVLARLLGDEFGSARLEPLTRDAFSFASRLVPTEDGISVLELFHGPTLAFKDFGARFLGRVFGALLAERGDHATILVATSGDTGSAVAHGFHAVPNLQVVVLYPDGKVSRFQEAQMATLGGNVRALKVPGVFDDCQRLVKTAFCDESLASLHLSSANSINVGRLLPQSVYYFHALLSVPHEAAGPSLLPETIFSVPSGNLGNLTAGVIAQRMGLPAARFLAACNVNDVLPEFLRTGTYRARPSVATASNAMDVGNPSNFVRLAALHGDSMEEMRANLAGYRVDEAETRATIREVYRRTGYVLDPHGAVGYAAALRYRAETGDRRPIVTLATAHPAKFSDVLREELGFEPALPAEYTGWESRPILAQALSDARYETFKEWLEGLKAGGPANHRA